MTHIEKPVVRKTCLLLLATLAIAGCQSKTKRVQQLQGKYNAAYPAYAKDCLDEDTSGAARLLTGQKLTAEQAAALEAKKKARDTRCKLQADHLAELQRQIIAAQQ